MDYSTPMQKLKNQFDQLKSILVEKGFKESNLNHSEPRTYVNYVGDEYENKGVKSDFIKKFKIKFNKENAYSIGFSFKYSNLPENEQTVTVTIKQGEDIFFKSEKLSVENMKDHFLKLLPTLNLGTHQEVINNMKAQFDLKSPIESYGKYKMKMK